MELLQLCSSNRRTRHKILNKNFQYMPTVPRNTWYVEAGKNYSHTNQGSSYRPITLLSPVVKVLEATILPFLKDHIPLHEHQHGVRPGHNTTTALCEISTFITEGLNSTRPVQRSILVALDLSKAFDMVDHAILKDIYDTTLPNTIKRWQITCPGAYLMLNSEDRNPNPG